MCVSALGELQAQCPPGNCTLLADWVWPQPCLLVWVQPGTGGSWGQEHSPGALHLDPTAQRPSGPGGFFPPGCALSGSWESYTFHKGLF